jgi:hypothetical protein
LDTRGGRGFTARRNLSRRPSEDREHAGVAVKVAVADLAGGEEADQRHITQRVPQDLQLR